MWEKCETSRARGGGANAGCSRLFLIAVWMFVWGPGWEPDSRLCPSRPPGRDEVSCCRQEFGRGKSSRANVQGRGVDESSNSAYVACVLCCQQPNGKKSSEGERGCQASVIRCSDTTTQLHRLGQRWDPNSTSNVFRQLFSGPVLDGPGVMGCCQRRGESLRTAVREGHFRWSGSRVVWARVGRPDSARSDTRLRLRQRFSEFEGLPAQGWN